jgi:peptidoglycan lytic transglycosylase
MPRQVLLPITSRVLLPPTAKGSILRLTAAHRSLSFDTRVRLTSVDTGRSVVVRINHRGPFVSGRIIDLSFGAARVIGLHTSGVAKVSMEVLR